MTWQMFTVEDRSRVVAIAIVGSQNLFFHYSDNENQDPETDTLHHTRMFRPRHGVLYEPIFRKNSRIRRRFFVHSLSFSTTKIRIRNRDEGRSR